MKKWKACFCEILGICILLAGSILFTGCSKLGVGSDPTGTPYPTGATPAEAEGIAQQERFGQVVLKVGGLEVSYGEIVLYMQSTKEEIETLYGREVWNYVLDDEGTTYAQMLKEELLKQITYTKLVCAQAGSLGISLTEDEWMDVDEYTDRYLSAFSNEQLNYYGITREIVRGIYSDNLLATKIYESLTLNVDTDISDEEARHPVLWYLFIAKYGIADDGSHTELTEEELQAVRERAESVAERAQQTNDFYTFAKNNTDDTDEIEIVVGRGDMFEALEKVAFGLLEGQTSGLVETEDGYFILHCKSYMEEEATEQSKIEIILARQEKAFDSSYAEWEERTSVWVDQELWNAIDLTGERVQ